MNRLVTLARETVQQGALPGQSRADLDGLRQSALATLEAHGFPDSRSEAFRYSRSKRLENMAFADAPGAVVEGATAMEAYLSPIRIAGAWSMVFVDGHYHAACSTPAVGDGLLCQNMTGFLEDKRTDDLPFPIEADDHGWMQANQACFSDGVVIMAEAGCRLEQPLQIIHVSTRAAAPVYVRNHVHMGADSHIDILESWLDISSSATLVNAVTDIQLDDHASLSLVRLDEDDRILANRLAHHRIHAGTHSTYRQHTFHLGGSLLRQETRIQLQQHASCSTEGLFMTRDRQESGHQLLIEHKAPDASSQVRYHGLADQASRGIFQGRILVGNHADRTVADMQSKNLLLSDQAEIDAMPQLEIHADDVRCAHGVSIGQLDETAIFYLESRGIARPEAVRLLMAGFANSMTDPIVHHGLRTHVRARLAVNLQFAPESFGLEP